MAGNDGEPVGELEADGEGFEQSAKSLGNVHIVEEAKHKAKQSAPMPTNEAPQAELFRMLNRAMDLLNEMPATPNREQAYWHVAKAESILSMK